MKNIHELMLTPQQIKDFLKTTAPRKNDCEGREIYNAEIQDEVMEGEEDVEDVKCNTEEKEIQGLWC